MVGPAGTAECACCLDARASIFQGGKYVVLFINIYKLNDFIFNIIFNNFVFLN